MTTSLYWRKIDSKLSEMYRSQELKLSTHCYYVENSFRRICADHIEKVLRSKSNSHEVAIAKEYYLDDVGFYVLVASMSYKQLLFSPLELYSKLNGSQHCGYKDIFSYSAARLVELKIKDESFYKDAMKQVKDLEDYCFKRKLRGEVIEF